MSAAVGYTPPPLCSCTRPFARSNPLRANQYRRPRPAIGVCEAVTVGRGIRPNFLTGLDFRRRPSDPVYRHGRSRLAPAKHPRPGDGRSRGDRFGLAAGRGHETVLGSSGPDPRPRCAVAGSFDPAPITIQNITYWAGCPARLGRRRRPSGWSRWTPTATRIAVANLLSLATCNTCTFLLAERVRQLVISHHIAPIREGGSWVPGSSLWSAWLCSVVCSPHECFKLGPYLLPRRSSRPPRYSFPPVSTSERFGRPRPTPFSCQSGITQQSRSGWTAGTARVPALRSTHRSLLSLPVELRSSVSA